MRIRACCLSSRKWMGCRPRRVDGHSLRDDAVRYFRGSCTVPVLKRPEMREFAGDLNDIAQSVPSCESGGDADADASLRENVVTKCYLGEFVAVNVGIANVRTNRTVQSNF